MAKPGSTEQCTPVDPNYGPSTGEKTSEEYLGAKAPLDHPCTQSTVDGNYSSGGGEGGGPKARTRSSKEESSDMAGVNGAEGAKYTDDE